MYSFIVNPAAGSGNALRVMSEIEAAIKEKKLEYCILYSKAPGDCTRLAMDAGREPECEAVIAVGGDGTVSEVAYGLSRLGNMVPMGIIPAGTGNDLIKSVGIPKSPQEALRILYHCKAIPVDTGMAGDRFFLNVCGTGFDVTVLDCTERYKKRFRGLIPYFLGLLNAVVHYRPVQLSITYDGKNEEGNFLICSIANGKYIGGGIPICPSADPEDGMLDLVLIRNIPRWKIPFYLPGLMMSKDLKFRITRHIRAENVRIQGNCLRINIDGDIYDASDISFRVQHASLMLIRPNDQNVKA